MALTHPSLFTVNTNIHGNSGDMEPDELMAELLHEILRNLEPHDLLNCRLVNQDWNHVACKFLKNRSGAIHLRTDENLHDFISTAANICDTNYPFSKIHLSVSNFVRDDIDLFAVTFGKNVLEYDLDLDFTGSTSCLTYYDAVEKVGVLLKNSPNLEILRIKDENIEMDFSKFKFLDHFPLVLPHLRVLEIKVDQLLRQSLGTKVHFGLIHSLLRISPVLLHFIIHFIGNGFWNSQLSSLLIAMQQVPRISLVNLSIRTEDVRRGNMQSLVAIKCQIQELSLVIMNSSCNPQVLFRLLYDWLEVDGQNLSKLQLKTDNVGFCFPFLQNLVMLELNLSKKLDINENAFLQRFLPEQFPKLEEVYLCNYSEGYDCFSVGVFPRVTTLTLDSYQEENMKEHWNRIFPNLKKLQILNAIPNHMSFVLTNFPYLHHLIVEFNSDKATDTDVAEMLSENLTIGSATVDALLTLKTTQWLQRLEIRNCGAETLNALLLLSSMGQFPGVSTLKCTVTPSRDLADVVAKVTKVFDRVVIRTGKL